MNPAPLFYCPSLPDRPGSVSLDAETRKHIVTVLRMTQGEQVHLTDGLGKRCSAVIEFADKKQLVVNITDILQCAPPTKRITLACSLLKHAARFEWMVEKVTEIGATAIIPLLCHRTERQHFRMDRTQQIVQSAALQSQNCWFPILHEPKSMTQLLSGELPPYTFIAHCMEGEKTRLSSVNQDAMLLIGPEGDFTTEEITAAREKGFAAVTLGERRLRTETAAVVGVVQLLH
jgi:16S rRNA (uracil1498-N3)-methyltransferase